MPEQKPTEHGPAPLLVSVPDAAKMLAIGQRKLWSLTNDKQIPCVRVGRSVRYDVRDLTNFIDKLKNG